MHNTYYSVRARKYYFLFIYFVTEYPGFLHMVPTFQPSGLSHLSPLTPPSPIRPFSCTTPYIAQITRYPAVTH